MRKFQAKSIDKMARAYNDHGGRLDYSSLDPQKHVDYGTDLGSTDIESDEAEGSFLEAIPTPQETRPLLDSPDHPPHPHSASPKSEEEEVVGSEDVDDDDDEEEEEEEEEQDNGLDVEKDAEKPVTMWTEEDEKNLRYLGTCELERNQCLENLIARRKHQRTFSTISERTFVAFDRSDVPSFQVTPLTRPHIANPFDVPDSTNPPSAPVPRKNPFDSPSTSPRSRRVNPFDVSNNPQDYTRKESVLRRYESFNPEYGFMGDGSGSRQGFMQIDRRDGLLPRHESFTTQSTFPNLFSLEKPTEGFQMKPVFAPTQEAQHASSMDRQSSRDSESMVSSGSDTESSVAPTNHEPEVTSKQHEDEEAIKMANRSPQNDQDEHQNAQTCDHGKEGKDGEGNKPTNTRQIEGEVCEPTSLPKNSTEESNANNTTNDEDQVPKEPIYDTSPSCVEKDKDFPLASET